jgi:hypothetical protein
MSVVVVVLPIRHSSANAFYHHNISPMQSFGDGINQENKTSKA